VAERADRWLMSGYGTFAQVHMTNFRFSYDKKACKCHTVYRVGIVHRPRPPLNF
jgi:hypothetical protein